MLSHHAITPAQVPSTSSFILTPTPCPSILIFAVTHPPITTPPQGNVAHDLKTPLFSFEADVEALRSFFAEFSPSSVIMANNSMQKRLGISQAYFDPIQPETIFDSMQATCRFMAMAINRSQDYMKATNGIALVPSNGTFNLPDAINQATSCIFHINPERCINFPPLGEDFCKFVISDKHWFVENLLCLLVRGRVNCIILTLLVCVMVSFGADCCPVLVVAHPLTVS
jgi:hypothetical protein